MYISTSSWIRYTPLYRTASSIERFRCIQTAHIGGACDIEVATSGLGTPLYTEVARLQYNLSCVCATCGQQGAEYVCLREVDAQYSVTCNAM